MTSYGSIEPNIKPTEVTALLRLAQESVKSQLHPDVTVNIVPGANECVAQSDEKLLGQVMMNLLRNACKYTSKGSITLGYEIYDDEIYFFVKDTGIGLTSDQKNRIADLFDNDDTASPGLGLGLPISNAIIKRLGGNIGVESRGTGRGSTFWFTIPYTASDEHSVEVKSEADDLADASIAQVDDNSPRRIKLLIAEDNASNYLLYQSMLKREYDLIHANDGIEAIEMFKKYSPDLIIMDIQMPNMDGYEAVREIRKLSADIPVIAATAYAFVTDRQRIIDSGFNGYVSKPINLQRLDREIKSCLGLN